MFDLFLNFLEELLCQVSSARQIHISPLSIVNFTSWYVFVICGRVLARLNC